VKPYAAERLHNLQESVIRSITRYAFEKGAILLAQGFPDFDPVAFPKKDATFDVVEKRFEKLQTLR
jgi:hypothetical protein